MTNRTDNLKTGDLVLLWDDIFERDVEPDWDGYHMMPPRKMKLHGKVGVVISRNDVFDDIYESQTWWVLVEGKKEEVHKNYMRKVENDEIVW